MEDDDMDYRIGRTDDLHLAALKATTARFFKEALPLLDRNEFGTTGEIAKLKSENERLQEIIPVRESDRSR